jgi:hypothetical protein
VFAAIEWNKLLEVIWVSALLGTAAIVCFALTIYGASRSSEARRAGQSAHVGFGAMGIVAFAGFGILVVFAIVTILDKS